MRRDLRILVAAARCCRACSAARAGGRRPAAADAAIATKMTGVADELARPRPASRCRTEQKAIVRDLDELIASLEKQCQACQNGIKRNNPTRGMADSMISRRHRRHRRPRRPRRERQGLGQALRPRARPHPPVDVRRLPARVSHGPRTLLPPPRRGEDRPRRRRGRRSPRPKRRPRSPERPDRRTGPLDGRPDARPAPIRGDRPRGRDPSSGRPAGVPVDRRDLATATGSDRDARTAAILLIGLLGCAGESATTPGRSTPRPSTRRRSTPRATARRRRSSGRTTACTSR